MNFFLPAASEASLCAARQQRQAIHVPAADLGSESSQLLGRPLPFSLSSVSRPSPPPRTRSRRRDPPGPGERRVPPAGPADNFSVSLPNDLLPVLTTRTTMLDTNQCLSLEPSPPGSPPMADDLEKAGLTSERDRLVYHSLKEGGPAGAEIAEI